MNRAIANLPRMTTSTAVPFNVWKPLFVVVFLTMALGSCAPVEPLGESASWASPDAETGTFHVTEEDYARAESMISRNLRSQWLYSGVRPQWMDDDRFWYRIRTSEGYRFFTVDPVRAEKTPSFDHEILADTLSALLEKEISPGTLPFTRFEYLEDGKFIRFEADDRFWECERETFDCRLSDAPEIPENSVLSPDRRWAAYLKDHNLWIRDLQNGEDLALTTVGVEGYGFATNSQGWFQSDRPVLNWSPDSRKIATYRLDERGVDDMHLLETAEDRPILHSWPYALPGDTLVPMLERVVLDIGSRTKIWLDVKPSHQRTSNCCGLERDGQWTDIHWSEDASQIAFVTTSRDYREVNLYIADTQTGDVRHVFSESARTFFESNLSSRGHPNWRVWFDSDRFIWFSRRDEWGHLYFHRLSDGEEISRITSGSWNVLDLLHDDEQSGSLWFTAVGKEEGRDPYREHLYRLDTSSGGGYQDAVIRLLTPQDAHHAVSMASSGSYFTGEYSGFQEPSVTVLYRADGTKIMTLERADISGINEAGWIPPEPFAVKARDGETDLYGILHKPTNFDPEKRYPVIVNIYPGPQIGSVGTRGFSLSRRGEPQALAELGFIVVQLDALGTPLRSKSFQTAWYGDMSDNGIEDQIAALHQLAERYPWVDAGRAGIYGHSGGGYATVSALLNFPGAFKAGVASAGNIDNRGYTYYWGEKYQGLRVVDEEFDSYAPQAIWEKAGKLRDHLLLSWGTMDSNVHPNSTLLLVDKLIEENRDFELIVFPNRGHGYAHEAYHLRRTWDFFVRHLHGTTPPGTYKIE